MAADNQNDKRPSESLSDRISDAIDEFLGALDRLLNPPQPKPIPIRVRYPQRRR